MYGSLCLVSLQVPTTRKESGKNLPPLDKTWISRSKVTAYSNLLIAEFRTMKENLVNFGVKFGYPWGRIDCEIGEASTTQWLLGKIVNCQTKSIPFKIPKIFI